MSQCSILSFMPQINGLYIVLISCFVYFARKNWSSFSLSSPPRKWSPDGGRRSLMSSAIEQRNRWRRDAIQLKKMHARLIYAHYLLCAHFKNDVFKMTYTWLQTRANVSLCFIRTDKSVRLLLLKQTVTWRVVFAKRQRPPAGSRIVHLRDLNYLKQLFLGWKSLTQPFSF